MIKKVLVVCALSGAALLQGCVSFNSLADAKNAKGTGEVRVYSAPKQDVWQKTVAIVQSSDLSIVSEDETKGLILAQQPISPLSLTAGQNVAIYVTESNGKTRVEVINKKAVGGIEFVSKDWDEYITEELDERFSR